MTDINKLCDELDHLLRHRDSYEPGSAPFRVCDRMYEDARIKAIQSLIDAARESEKLRERIKELEINERAWLIEKQISNTPVWLCGIDAIGFDTYPLWTSVATDAVRFCRELDAKKMMNHYLVFGDVIATEHIFLNRN